MKVLTPKIAIFFNNETCRNPVGKIAENAVCKSVFLTTWHCILSGGTPSDFFGDFAHWKIRLTDFTFIIFKSNSKAWLIQRKVSIPTSTYRKSFVLVKNISSNQVINPTAGAPNQERATSNRTWLTQCYIR